MSLCDVWVINRYINLYPLPSRPNRKRTYIVFSVAHVEPRITATSPFWGSAVEISKSWYLDREGATLSDSLGRTWDGGTTMWEREWLSVWINATGSRTTGGAIGSFREFHEAIFSLQIPGLCCATRSYYLGSRRLPSCNSVLGGQLSAHWVTTPNPRLI